MKQLPARYSVLILAAAFLTILIGLNTPKIYFGDAVFYINSGMHMVRSGDWLTPVHAGSLRFQKPPLFYWLVAGSYKIFRTSLFAARLPSVLALLALVFVVRSTAKLLFDSENSGFYSALVFLSLPMVFWYGRSAMTDTVLAFFLTLSFYLAIKGCFQQKGRLSYFLGSFAAMGFGVLTKGIVGLLFPALAITLYVIFSDKERKILWKYFHPVNWLIFLAIVLPWFLLMYLKHGAEHFDYMLKEGVTSRIGFSPVKPLRAIAYYAGVLVRYHFPWILIVAVEFIRRRGTLRGLWKKSRDALLPVLLFVAVVLTTHVFLVSDNRARYLLPLTPFLALTAGYAISETEKNADKAKVMSRLLLWLFAAFAGIQMIILGLTVSVTARTSFLSAFPSVVNLSAVMIGSAVTILLFVRSSFRTFVISSALTLLVSVNIALGLTVPSISPSPVSDLMRECPGKVGHSQKVFGYRLSDGEMTILNIRLGRQATNITDEQSAGYAEIIEPSKGTCVLLQKREFSNLPDEAKEKYETVSESFGFDRLDARELMRALRSRTIESFLEEEKVRYLLLKAK